MVAINDLGYLSAAHIMAAIYNAVCGGAVVLTLLSALDQGSGVATWL